MATKTNASQARLFWEKKDRAFEHENDVIPAGKFKRSASFRSALRSPLTDETIWNNIYGTIRDRKRSRARSLATTSSLNNVNSIAPKYITMQTSLPRRSNTIPKKCITVLIGDSRSASSKIWYETKCFFMPKIIPVWYTSTISVSIVRKKQFTEKVFIVNKMIPFRTVESINVTPSAKGPQFIAQIEINIEVSPEHYINLEPQQEVAESQGKLHFMLIDVVDTNSIC